MPAAGNVYFNDWSLLVDPVMMSRPGVENHARRRRLLRARGPKFPCGGGDDPETSRQGAAACCVVVGLVSILKSLSCPFVQTDVAVD
jgi:hypothetical protein